jgi:hypothetical protein
MFLNGVFDYRRGLITTGHSPSAGGDSSGHTHIHMCERERVESRRVEKKRKEKKVKSSGKSERQFIVGRGKSIIL